MNLSDVERTIFFSGKKILLGHKENLMKLLDDKEWMGVLGDCFLANRPSAAIAQANKDDLTAPAEKKAKKLLQPLSDKERKKVRELRFCSSKVSMVMCVIILKLSAVPIS